MVVGRTTDEERTQLLNKQLGILSLKLIPHDDFIKTGKEIAQKVYERIAQKSQYKIARFLIAGSIGKKTSIVGSDVDCVIFINDQEPLFKDVISEFKDIIDSSGISHLTVENVTKHSLKLMYKNNDVEIGLDLLPATNFVNVYPPRPSPASESEQALRVFEKLQKKSDNSSIHAWSPCLAETNMKFMAKQSSFVHQFTRLAKFWNSTLMYFKDNYVSGRSTIIEMIAIYAANEEERLVYAYAGSGPPQMFRTFRAFLELVDKLDDPRLVIEFDFNALSDCIDPGKRTLVRPKLEAKDGRCTIRDAANPFLNLMTCLKDTDIEKFQICANETIRLLENCDNAQSWVKYGPGDLYFPLELVFQPNPLVFDQEQVKALGLAPHGGWGVETQIGRSEISPVIRMTTKFSAFQNRLIEKIKNYLLIYVMAVSANPGATSVSVRDIVNKCIDKSILDVPERQWITADGQAKDEDYDFNFIIPFKIGEDFTFSIVRCLRNQTN